MFHLTYAAHIEVDLLIDMVKRTTQGNVAVVPAEMAGWQSSPADLPAL
jgi:hypothetical protein